MKKINEDLFSYCDKLQHVSIPESVTKIGGDAFYNCAALTEIELPKNLKKLGGSAFACSGLVRVELPEGLTATGECAFRGCAALTEVVLPNSLTMISRNTFENCTGLTSIAIPDQVTTIEWSAFEGCTRLTSVTLPAGLTVINTMTFRGCTALKNVNFPASLDTIMFKAFEGCTALESISLPESLRAVGLEAFLNCEALKSVNIPCNVKIIDTYAFGYRYSEVPVEETDEDVYWEPAYEKLDGFTVYGAPASAAKTYAVENEFDFVAVNCFVDVKEDDFFFNPVMWALDNEVTGGIDVTHFAPEQTVMRCDAMTFFWAANNRPAHSLEQSPFKDVKAKHWYYNAVMWAVENGITGGTDETHFSPKQTCTRSEILQFLYAAMGKPEYHIENPYSDVKAKSWYSDGAIWAYEAGLERGEDGKFQAKTPCTRGYVVTYLYRFVTGQELDQ